MIASGAYSRRREKDGESSNEWRAFSRSGRSVVSGDLTTDAFPRRWNPRRSIPSEYEPLCSVVGHALEAAGWWQPRSGELVDGGLVVVHDGGPESAIRRFAHTVHDPEAMVLRPSGFLQALPSTLSSVLGLLYGLCDYHATLVGGTPAGVRGLRHLLDLIALGRLERGVLAVLSDDGGLANPSSCDFEEPAAALPSSTLAVALCFDRAAGDSALSLDCGWEVALTPSEVSRDPGRGAALSLLGLAKHLETCFCGMNPADADSAVRWSGTWGWIELYDQASLSQ